MANKILSWKYIYPLSRLTYCAYLVHPAITRAMILRGESTFHLTEGFVVRQYHFILDIKELKQKNYTLFIDWGRRRTRVS